MLQDEGLSFDLEMTGRNRLDEKQLRSYGVKNLIIHNGLSANDKLSMLNCSDVFVFPSLCEGFAFSIIEAMATGLPIIATTRTAGKDIIDQGEEGFVIPPSDENAVADKMRYFINRPEKCTEMGRKAAERARTLTWDLFEQKIEEAVDFAENALC